MSCRLARCSSQASPTKPNFKLQRHQVSTSRKQSLGTENVLTAFSTLPFLRYSFIVLSACIFSLWLHSAFVSGWPMLRDSIYFIRNTRKSDKLFHMVLTVAVCGDGRRKARGTNCIQRLDSSLNRIGQFHNK